MAEAGTPPPAAVVCNALPLRRDGAGVSTYIRELLALLPARLGVPVQALVARDAVHELPPGVGALARRPAAGARRALQGLGGAPPSLLFHGLDVDVPWGSAVPRVSTVHDLSVFDVPDGFSRRRVAGERLLVRRAVRAADEVLAVSEFTAERLAECLGRRDAVVTEEAPSPWAVPPPPAAVEAVRRRYGLPARFVLHVGSIEPRKRLDLLADLCGDLGVPLVLAGPAGWATRPPPTARWLGFTPAGDLPGLYGAATVAAYLPRYEGFGLPPLDAMACGCPVVSTRVPSMARMGDVAALVATDRAEDMARVLGDLLADHDRRAELARLGPAAAGRLSWRHTAERTAEVYARLGVPLASLQRRP